MGKLSITCNTRSPLAGKADTLVTMVPDGKESNKLLGMIDKRTGRLPKKLAKRGEISGSRGRLGQFYIAGPKPKKVYCLGMGDRLTIEPITVKNSLADAVRAARDSGGHRLSFDADLLLELFPAREAGLMLGEIFSTCQYRFEKYIHRDATRTIDDFSITTRYRRKAAELREGVRIGELLGTSINRAKDIGNEPSNVLTPSKLADLARAVAKEEKLKITVLGPKEMEKLGMGLLLAVSKGSAEEPRLIALEYRGDRRSKKFTAIVGKGITFDAGGINLKHGSTMFEMKRDLSGGAIALGMIQILSRLKVTENVVVVIPACENMPQGNAYKPGDIYLSMAGKYVEIMNTDAEGRLILADALTYAQKTYNVETLIDIGTLTTNSVQTIGPGMMPVFTNDDALHDEMVEASLLAGEEMWRHPLNAKYKKGIRSYFADLKNLSMTSPQLIKTALFLQEFIQPDTRWFHFDIASVDSANKESGLHSRGASMTSQRLLANWFFKRHGII